MNENEGQGGALGSSRRAPHVHVRREGAAGTPEAPGQRSGKQCGYSHREAVHDANKALGKALSVLARDRDPHARRAGADIAAAAAEIVGQLAFLATNASSVQRRAAADVAAMMPQMERRLADLRSRMEGRGTVPSGPGPDGTQTEPRP